MLIAAAWLVGDGRFAVEARLAGWVRSADDGAPHVTRLLSRIGYADILLPVTALLAGALWTVRGWRSAAIFAVCAEGARLAAEALKRLAARPRPALWPHGDLHAVGWSFPSAHATNSMAVLLGFALLWGGRVPLAGALVVSGLIGLSRIALGVHWPSDVLAGWALGAMLAITARVLASRLNR